MLDAVIFPASDRDINASDVSAKAQDGIVIRSWVNGRI
jgi:hypothetical protein